MKIRVNSFLSIVHVFVRARKGRAENRSVSVIHEDSSTVLTKLFRKLGIEGIRRICFSNVQFVLVLADASHEMQSTVDPASACLRFPDRGLPMQ